MAWNGFQQPQYQVGNVRCPTCNKILRPPPGAPTFRCPCSQILRAPVQPQPQYQQYQPPPQQTSQNPFQQQPPQVSQQQGLVRCPSCNKTLKPPANAPRFRCPCGIVLAAPNQNNQNTALVPPRQPAPPQPSNDRPNLINIQGNRAPALNSSFRHLPQRGVGKQVDENLLPEEIEKDLKNSSDEFWLRNLGADGKLYWVRLLSNDQEEKLKTLLSGWHDDMEKNIDSMEEEDLEFRFDLMGLTKASGEEHSKDYLKKKILGAKEFLLSTATVKEVIARLNKMNVDHTSCQSLDDYVERLVAAAWYGPNKFADGFVRVFKNDFDLSVIPAQQYGLDIEYGTYKLTPDELEKVTQSGFRNKVKWFTEQCNRTRGKWDDGRVKVNVRRDFLLKDSYLNFIGLKPEDFKMFFRFTFLNEEALDAGGVAREWFEQVTTACFDVDFGLFEYTGEDTVSYQFNPVSGVAIDKHEEYYRFVGRLIGKALFDQKVIPAHLTQPIFKHILGFPITLTDLQFSNKSLYQNLVEMEQVDDIADCMLTFTTNVETFGEVEEIELKEGGGEIDVTNSNYQEYVQLLTQYYLFERTKTQLGHFLRGIYDIIPQVWLSVFDYKELELMLCGMPNINVQDWKANTKYRKEYEKQGANNQVIRWFWEWIEECEQDKRALILQFCTGTSRVPVGGFASLQGNDGNLMPFTIDPADLKTAVFPAAHTCFNRIELPMYKSKAQLVEKCEIAIKQESGFGME